MVLMLLRMNVPPFGSCGSEDPLLGTPGGWDPHLHIPKCSGNRWESTVRQDKIAI